MSDLDVFERLYDIRKKIADLQVAERDLELEILAKYKPGDEVEDVAEVVQPMKFSAAQAEKVLDPKVLAAVRVPSVTITAAKAKELLTPEMYAKCQVPNGQPKIKFKEKK